MTITALIIDNEQLARDELKYLLDSTGEVDILAEGSNGFEAVDLIQTHHPDLVFLDVQMPGLDGFAVIKKLLDKKVPIPMPQIIFATAFDQYAVKAFDVNAIDYLLKPFDRERVLQALNRARERVEKPPPGGHSAQEQPSQQPWERTRASTRYSVYSSSSSRPPDRRTARSCCRRRTVCCSPIRKTSASPPSTKASSPSSPPALEGQSKCRTLEELLELLDPATFWRAHRSHVVNINHIKEVVPWFKSSYQLRMDDKKQTEIPVSRTQTRRLRELFNL